MNEASILPALPDRAVNVENPRERQLDSQGCWPLPDRVSGAAQPIRAGGIAVEFEATTEQARGAYTLTLWDADGRSVILENVTFP